ncbi:MAG: leucine-rich repeat protein [Clostridia bacterium]|nr:leucine-rich repeat protein [Clostridia bacterium]
MKNRKSLICIIVILLIVVGTTLSACGGETRSLYFSAETYHVYMDGVKSVTPELISRPRDNEYVLTISNPTIAKIEEDGKTVTGIKEGIVTITATSGEITTSATLIVHLKTPVENNNVNPNAGKHMVFFITEYASVPAQYVADGECAVKPTAPERIGYYLYGWYTDPDFTEQYDFNTPVNGNINLYALWSYSDPQFKFTTLGDKTYVNGFKYSYIPYETVTLPSTDNAGNEVVGVAKAAFAECESLVSLTIPDTYFEIQQSAFNKNTKLETVIFEGAGLRTIGDLAFAECSKLKSVTFGGTGLTSIGVAAFTDCSSLQTMEIPDTVNKIGSEAFNKCTSFNITKLPKNLSTIEMSAFAYTAIVSLDLTGIEAINNTAFWGATSLKTLTNADSLKRVGSYAFGSLTSSSYNEATEWLKTTSVTTTWSDKTGSQATYLGNVLVYVSPVGIGTKPLPTYIKSRTVSIAGQAFSDINGACAYFTSATPPTYGTNAFGGTTAPTIDIVVPSGATEAYAKAWLITSTDEDGYYVPSAYSMNLLQSIYEFSVYPYVETGLISYSRYPLYDYGNGVYYSKLNAQAAGDPFGGIQYSTADKYFVVHSYFGEATTLDLKTMFESDAQNDGGRTAYIEKICSYAFSNNRTMQSLTLTNRIFGIDTFAFMECSVLKTMYIFGDDTFYPSKTTLFASSFNATMMPQDLVIYVPQALLERFKSAWNFSGIKNAFAPINI